MESSHRRRCKTDNFLCICGRFILKSQGRHLLQKVKSAYFLYFGCKFGDQDKSWTPYVCCVSCNVTFVQGDE